MRCETCKAYSCVSCGGTGIIYDRKNEEDWWPCSECEVGLMAGKKIALEQIVADYENRCQRLTEQNDELKGLIQCIHCGQLVNEHTETSSCLFSPTKYKAGIKDDKLPAHMRVPALPPKRKPRKKKHPMTNVP